jgi:uncharacterized Zn finger protein
MSEPYHGIQMDIKCPYCGDKEQEVEDLGDSPVYLSGECGECWKMYSVDVNREEYYDEGGNVIK